MLCYRDMTFCCAYKITCKNHHCHRAMTKEEQARADEWGKPMGHAPVAYSDFSRDCPIIVPITPMDIEGE